MTNERTNLSFCAVRLDGAGRRRGETPHTSIHAAECYQISVARYLFRSLARCLPTTSFSLIHLFVYHSTWGTITIIDDILRLSHLAIVCLKIKVQNDRLGDQEPYIIALHALFAVRTIKFFQYFLLKLISFGVIVGRRSPLSLSIDRTFWIDWMCRDTKWQKDEVRGIDTTRSRQKRIERAAAPTTHRASEREQ